MWPISCIITYSVTKSCGDPKFQVPIVIKQPVKHKECQVPRRNSDSVLTTQQPNCRHVLEAFRGTNNVTGIFAGQQGGSCCLNDFGSNTPTYHVFLLASKVETETEDQKSGSILMIPAFQSLHWSFQEHQDYIENNHACFLASRSVN